MGPSSCPSFSVPLPFARSFFFCRFARFFEVLASACSSRSRFRRSNSASSASYRDVSRGFVHCSLACPGREQTYLLRLLIHHFQSLVLSPPACFVHVEFSTPCSSTRPLYVLHHLACWPNALILGGRRDVCRLCGILQQLLELYPLFVKRCSSMTLRRATGRRRRRRCGRGRHVAIRRSGCG